MKRMFVLWTFENLFLIVESFLGFVTWVLLLSLFKLLLFMKIALDFCRIYCLLAFIGGMNSLIKQVEIFFWLNHLDRACMHLIT